MKWKRPFIKIKKRTLSRRRHHIVHIYKKYIKNQPLYVYFIIYVLHHSISFSLSLTHVISTLKLKIYSKMFRRRKKREKINKNFDFNCDRRHRQRCCTLFCYFLFSGKFACFLSESSVTPIYMFVWWVCNLNNGKMCMNGTFRKKIERGWNSQ